ncbi:MAG TPA: DUF5946 family protein [Thermomicrobiales bacterium]|nr:DUF5946 family protein [Thermomicrobiales bacterium]
MRCGECGAETAGDETCLARFHSLLAAEVDNEELRRMHGLTVLTYHLQHPSLTKPWFQLFGADVFRRVFGQGEDWGSVLMETHPRRIGRRADLADARLKAAGGPTMPGWVVSHPIAGELTIATIDPGASPGPVQQILAWARSVAEYRVLRP